MAKTKKIRVQDTEISVFMDEASDYICLTDMVKAKRMMTQEPPTSLKIG